MTIMRNIRMTTLVEVTSKGSGGRARILSGIPVATTMDSLTNREFSNMEVGDRAIVKLAYTPSRRKIMTITKLSNSDVQWSVAGFLSFYKRELESEQEAYMNAYGTVASTGASAVAAPSIEADLPRTNWFEDKFWISNEDLKALTAASKLSKMSDIPTKVMMIGPSGYGKTTAPQAFANANGYKYCRFNVALVRDPEEFLGYRTIEDGDVKFVPSEFTKAIEQGNTVVVLDELNRASPEMANALFPLLDDSAETWVYGNHIKVGPNTIIVATLNLGYQFSGTYSLDQALVNRFDITIQVGALPADVERKVIAKRVGIDLEVARQIVEVANNLRNANERGAIEVDASTRTTLKVARLMTTGVTIEEAFRFVVVNGANIDERKDVLDTIRTSLS